MSCFVGQKIRLTLTLVVIAAAGHEAQAQSVLVGVKRSAATAVDTAPRRAMVPGAQNGDSVVPAGAAVELITERFPNGDVRIEREVAQDTAGNYVNHGRWKMRDEQGNIVAEGRYAAGRRVGLWNGWYLRDEAKLFATPPYDEFSPPFISQATFDRGRLHGKWTIYDAKQRMVSQWEFVDGMRDGKSQWWYVSGAKMREIDYRQGLVDGHLRQWTRDSQLAVEEVYQAGRKLAVRTSKFADGTVRWEGTYLHAKSVPHTPDDWWSAVPVTYQAEGDDHRHGAWAAWYANGQKQVEGRYRHDKKTGTFTWWYQNGQKHVVGKFIDGQRHGQFTWWYANGQKQREATFARGVPAGPAAEWTADGQTIRNPPPLRSAAAQ